MAKSATKTKDKLEFDRMPGSDPQEAGERIDLNFMADPEEEEIVDELQDDAEEDADEAEEVVDEVEEVEEEADAPEETVDEVEEDDESTAEVDEEADDEQNDPVENSDDAEPEPEPKKKQPMVPKSRLDEVLAKQKALQKQLEALQSEQQDPAEAPEAYDFDAKEEEYMNAILDGNAAKAKQLRKEMRQAEKDALEYQMAQKVQQTTSHDRNVTALQQAASEIEAAFPVFDQSSPDFNKEYTDEVVELRDAFMSKGRNAVESLTKAVEYVVRSYNLDAMGDSTPEPKAQQTKKRRTVADKVKVARSQPPAARGEGTATRKSPTIDPLQMSDDEFNALPEATLKRLRGDLS